MTLRVPTVAAALLFAVCASAHATSPVSPRAKASAPEMPSRVLSAAAPEAAFFRAANVPIQDIVSLPAPAQKSAAGVDDKGRLRVASVRALPKAANVPDWVSTGEGNASRLRATSEGARGLRVSLNIGAHAAPLEIRAQGTDGRIETMTVNPSAEAEVWTPWTEGASQVIELFSPPGAQIPTATLTGVLHFDQSPFEKASAAECTVPVSCTTNDPTLDAAIAERTKSSVRITFVENGSGFLCSATLINTPRFPAGYLLTANHCVSTAAAASSVTSFWFYEPNSCTDATLKAGAVQVPGGTQLVFTNYNPDSTLLLTNQTPPPGAIYSGWDANRLSSGDSVVSISHPRGDTTRLALATITREYRLNNRAQDEYGVKYTRGIIEGGSSGSGLFTLSGGSLLLRGILTGTTIRDGSLSCTNLDEEGLYGRFDIFYPEIAAYINSGGPAADDTPNRVIDWTSFASEAVLNNSTIDFSRSIEYVGDVDVFQFTVGTASTVTIQSQGSMDTVGTLMEANGKAIITNDDVSGTNTNFGITRTLQPGTYYVLVAPWDPSVTGAYRLVISAAASAPSTPTTTETNYSDLWWSTENGWGINLSHQGDIIFATLYTYETNGSPTWWAMSNGVKQPDGSFSGTLYRGTGPAYTSPTWSPASANPIGTMRISFDSAGTGTLTYTVGGATVTKSIRRFQFSTPTTCTWTNGDRSAATNYQDLWWDPNESGWGLNIAHQGNTLFVLLYVYDASGQPMWFSMSNGALVSTRTWSGRLFRATGPAFNANPWTTSTATDVGQMTVMFNDGETGALTYTVNGAQVTKSIRRTVFSNPKPICSSS